MKKYISLLVLSLIIVSLNAQNLQLKEGKVYKEGKCFSGIDFTYFEGTKHKQSETTFKKGLKNGIEVLYFENGQEKSERHWKKGEKHGVWISWDEKGNKTAEASYVKNKKDGIWMIWSSSGQKLFEMHYKMGSKVGIWKQWNEDSELIMEKTF